VLPEYFPAIAVQVQRPPIHTTSRAAPCCNLAWACDRDGFAVRCTSAQRAALANRISSAIGTPLEWPEAKKVASHVRSWGIEVWPPIVMKSVE
jgi:hypothetical protein